MLQALMTTQGMGVYESYSYYMNDSLKPFAGSSVMYTVGPSKTVRATCMK